MAWMNERLKLFFVSRVSPTDVNVYRTGNKVALVAHGDYSSIAHCLTKIPAIFRGLSGTLSVY
jgi:hypothetical protein